MEMERQHEADIQNGKTVKLKTSDQKIFDVQEAVALQSVVIKNVAEDFGSENPIPLPSVSSDILEKIIQYCTHHVHHSPRPMETQDDVDPWDVDFVKLDHSILFQLVLAAEYLDIRSLFDLVCRAIANAISACKTPEKVRRVFNIENNLTPQEQEAIKREVPWSFDN